MAVKIRLKQTGKRNKRAFRIVVVDESKKRDGKVIEEIGWVNPQANPAVTILQKDRLSYWQSVGAQITVGAKKHLTTT